MKSNIIIILAALAVPSFIIALAIGDSRSAYKTYGAFTVHKKGQEMWVGSPDFPSHTAIDTNGDGILDDVEVTSGTNRGDLLHRKPYPKEQAVYAYILENGKTN